MVLWYYSIIGIIGIIEIIHGSSSSIVSSTITSSITGLVLSVYPPNTTYNPPLIIIPFITPFGGASGGLRRPFSARAGSAGTLRHASSRVPTSMATALLSRPARGLSAAPWAPYPPARFGPPCARCLPAHAHSPRRGARLCSSRPPSSALRHAPPAPRLSCGTFRREPATRQFDGSFAAAPTCQDRFARQAPSELRPGLPPASLAAGAVHCLSGRAARASYN